MVEEFLGLPMRPGKPRERGLTHVIDKGMTLSEVEGMFETAGDYVDIVKLGWGTSYVTRNLAEKIKLYQSQGVPVMCGGTLLEAAVARGKVDEFRRWTAGYGFTHVEVSDGTLQIERDSKQELISALAEEFVVLSEVGSKDSECVYAPYQWVAWIKEELEAGASKVITEARETGTAGIFRGTGEVRSGLIDEIVHEIPLDQLLFEAPQKDAAGLVHPPPGRRGQPGQHPARRGDPAGDAAAGAALRHHGRPAAARPAHPPAPR